MLASRQAISRGLSYKHLLLAGTGDFQASTLPPPAADSDEEIPFSDTEVDSIKVLKVYFRIEGDETALAWLRENFGELSGSG